MSVDRMTLEGKTAVVTGAARGIGRGIAFALAESGMNVVLSDLGAEGGGHSYTLSSSAELESAAKEADARGPGRALAIPCDVTRADQVTLLVEQTKEELGGIDLLINNAGVVHMVELADIDEATWDRVHAVNVKGVYLVSRAALESLLEREGSIINIASVAGKRGYAAGTAYCSSKFAVVGFTQALAMELAGRGVRVNAICPGILPTHMWTHHLSSEERGGEVAYEGAIQAMVPLGREQSPEDVADAVRYLATAPNVTGVALNVAGGMEVW